MIEEHNLQNITKVVSGSNNEALDFVDMLYKSVVKAGPIEHPLLKLLKQQKL